MVRTKRVHAALHAELSEYASLLRAIKTNSKLDIVPQLSGSNPVHREDEDEDEEDSFESEEAAQNNGDPPSRKTSGYKGKGKAKVPSKTKSPRRQRVNWTRWPLLEEHCPVPEWSFDEEVKTITDQYLRSQNVARPVAGSSMLDTTRDLHSSTITDGAQSDDDGVDSILSSGHLAGLTSDAASRLLSVLSLLAFHRPNVTLTKHGRVDPMGWEDVLDVVGVSGVFDQRVVGDVKERMEALFGPSQSQVVYRMQVLDASRRALAEADASWEQDALPMVEPKSRRVRKKRKRATLSEAEYATAVAHDAADRPPSEDHIDDVMEMDERAWLLFELAG